MVLKEISSPNHPKIKELVRIRADKSARASTQSVLILGEKMIRELALKGHIQELFTVNPAPDILAKSYYLVNQEILTKISGMPTTDGFAALASMPKTASLSDAKRVLILDRLSDPGNLGTLLRTALALNWDGVLFTPETVDPFNDKALRASKGALFTLPFAFKSISETVAFIQERRITPYLADLTGMPLDQAQFQKPLALILSNEATGPSEWAEKLAQKIAIPMHNEVESLNVAASGAILLYYMGNG